MQTLNRPSKTVPPCSPACLASQAATPAKEMALFGSLTPGMGPAYSGHSGNMQ